MTTEEKVRCCPFCGAAWTDPEKAHRRWLKKAEETVIVLVTSTLMVLLLKSFGL